MYTRQEASLARRNFWTRFGQYMRPVRNAEGEEVNWINYKTGIRGIFFRMDVDNKQASVGIEIRHSDTALRIEYFQRIQNLKSMFGQIVGKDWIWDEEFHDEHGQPIGRIFKRLPGVNIFNENNWPAVISFLKEAIIKLDLFWINAKELIEN